MERITSLFERAKSGILFGIPTKQKLGKRIEKLSEKEGFKKILVLLEILHGLAKAKDYSVLLDAARVNIDTLPECPETTPADAAARYNGDLERPARYVGYTLNQESFKFLMDPMLQTGVEKVSAMG